MFEYLKGDIFIDDNDSSVVVDCGGVGYLLNCSLSTIADLKGKESATLYTYMSVSDNGISLYGFSTKIEREVFLNLISVPKVGARSAVAILSLDTPGNIVSYVLAKDVTALSKASGIGKKTAETIIVSLVDKFEKLALFFEDSDEYYIYEESSDINATEAVDALIALGFDRTRATRSVNAVKEDGMSSEEILALALSVING
ncbi:MAG: Holliday junction branch migration protein RuvA [Anaerofustis stercorihominis]|nr:Holliday junction branch migration protein RuvA [Anaerofustis stercorihominis]